MYLILANRILATEKDYRMFLRMAGTRVSQSKFSDVGYKEGESAILIQKLGSPNYDSGYRTRTFPATIAGLRAAKWAWEGVCSGLTED